jgi:hypothetical protein
MLYNENISYNQPSLSYIGTVIINVLGISNPIIISNLNVAVSISQDYSNATTVAVISYDIYSEGILTIQATESQANAIIQVLASYDEGASGAISLEAIGNQTSATSVASTVSLSSGTAEVTIS